MAATLTPPLPSPNLYYYLTFQHAEYGWRGFTWGGWFLEVPGVPVGLAAAIAGARVAHLVRSMLGNWLVLGKRCRIPGMLCMSLGFLFLGQCSSLVFVFFVSSGRTEISVCRRCVAGGRGVVTSGCRASYSPVAYILNKN